MDDDKNKEDVEKRLRSFDREAFIEKVDKIKQLAKALKSAGAPIGPDGSDIISRLLFGPIAYIDRAEELRLLVEKTGNKVSYSAEDLTSDEGRIYLLLFHHNALKNIEFTMELHIETDDVKKGLYETTGPSTLFKMRFVPLLHSFKDKENLELVLDKYTLDDSDLAKEQDKAYLSSEEREELLDLNRDTGRAVLLDAPSSRSLKSRQVIRHLCRQE